MHSYYICVRKCENKSTSESERACAVWGNACCAALGGRGGLRVKDRWSLSGVVPPLPLSFSLPSGSDIFSLSPLQNLTSSVFFVFFCPQHLLSSHPSLYYLKSQLGSSLTLLRFYLFKPLFFPSPALLPSCQVFCWRNQLENTKRFLCDCHSGPCWHSTKDTREVWDLWVQTRKKGAIDSYGQWTILTIFLNIIRFSWISCCLVAY